MDIDKSIKALEAWFDTNGLAGYDPFDVKGHSLLIRFQKYAVLRKPMNLFVELSPWFSRKLFRIKPEINAKAMALLTLGYLNRYHTTKDEKYLNRASETGKWLVDHGTDWNPDVVGWGYPFDWQSRVMIPRGTPSSVVTAFALQALVELHEMRPDIIGDPEKFFRMVGDFFTTQLNRTPGGCFSYTPVDDFQVHNANLLTAYSLALLSYLSDHSEYLEAAEHAVDYTIRQQGAAGEFGYWGDEPRNPIVDNFHTGYVMRMLARINSILKLEHITQVLEKAIGYYINNLFENDFPKDRNNRLYPIDIHTLADVLLVYCEFPEYRDQLQPKMEKTLEFVLTKMQYQPGCYAYKRYPTFMVKFPFLRWNQAWVYYALTELVKIYK